MAPGRPNILLIVSDQERQRSWLPPTVSLPWRERLLADGLEFTNHWTHSSPCSPSRATMMTGLHVPQHAVPDNVIHPHHGPLDPALPTAGKLLAGAGYRSSYIGKWHLSYGPHPDMESYGYTDWEGNDLHYMGWAGTGAHFDPIIADMAAHWLRTNTGTLAADGQPWFLTVALVNPHDVMWFPIDQPAYRRTHADELEMVRSLLAAAQWKEGDVLPAFEQDYDEVFDELPANFDDDLHTKPEAQRQWRWDQQHGLWGHIDPGDKEAWLRHLDYYVKLHQLGDESLGTVLGALDETGLADDTVVLFTSDHGDMCGSHGLRSKGPFLYDEIMRVPLYVKAPGITEPGTATAALSSAVDLVATICGLAGVEPPPSVQGVDQGPVLAEPATSVRDHVLFAMDSAHTRNIQQTRYAIRGYFDGRYKYARYYGVGGGKPNDDFGPPTEKLFGPGADFDDHDHELYDHADDPHELVNLAMDRGRRHDVRRHFARLLELETDHFG
jgi:arylsulfatase A-like enzyme